MADTTPVILTDNPALGSKINWTQYISVGAALLSLFGLNLTQDQQMMILQVLVFATPALTWFWRTFMTGKEATKTQLTTALEGKGLKVTTKPVPS